MADAELNREDNLALVRRLPAMLEHFREMLLANLVMIGEIPAPTFHETERIQFLQQRFTECGLDNCSTDEIGNVLAILPGMQSGRSILVTAHADTPFAQQINHTLSLDPTHVTGPGVADNSLGVAALATLPTILDKLDIRLNADLVLMGAVQNLGRGNLGGLRFFLEHHALPLIAGLALEGAQLGHLHYVSKASLGGEISVEVKDNGDARDTAQDGAIVVLNVLMDRLKGIDLSLDPLVELTFGVVQGGTSYKKPARRASLQLALRSDSDENIRQVNEQLQEIVQGLADETEAAVEFEVIASSKAGLMEDDHALILEARRVITALGIQPHLGCCSSAVSSFTEHDIATISIGLSQARNLNQLDETVAIEPMFKGLAQLIGILLAIDGGACD